MKKTLKVLKTAFRAYALITLIFNWIGYCGRLLRDSEDGTIKDDSLHGFAATIWDDFKYYINWWIEYAIK